MLTADGEDTLIAVKAVPGGSRDVIAGVVGDRLKVKVSAPAEGGKANAAIVRVIATALGVKGKDVVIETGATSPVKVVRVRGVGVDEVRGRLRV